MAKQREYSVIEADNVGELVEAVTEATDNGGWRCQGGICIWYEPAGPTGTRFERLAPIVHYAQALVRSVKHREDIPTPPRHDMGT